MAINTFKSHVRKVVGQSNSKAARERKLRVPPKRHPSHSIQRESINNINKQRCILKYRNKLIT